MRALKSTIEMCGKLKREAASPALLPTALEPAGGRPAPGGSDHLASAARRQGARVLDGGGPRSKGAPEHQETKSKWPLNLFSSMFVVSGKDDLLLFELLSCARF